MFKPSPFQAAVFDFIKNGTGSAIIEAVAGSGKTTTIVNGLQNIPSDKKVIMLAFNKVIADELSSRVNLPNVEIKTLHAAGFAALRKINRNLKVDNNKINDAVKGYCNHYGIDPKNIPGFENVKRIVSLGKNSGIGILCKNTFDSWEDIINHHAIFDDNTTVDLNKVINACIEILNHSANYNRNVIDFDDMIYMPLYHKANFQKYDFVFVDEAQDCSEINRMILKNLLKDGGRLIAVGDPYQAIYGFRGAASDSMSMIQAEFSATKLPLSVSYRCATSIIAEARKTVSHILPFEGASEGSVVRLEKYSPGDFNKSDAIICRNTAPLISMAYSMISRNIPVNVLGRDIGKGLITLATSLNAKTISDMLIKLDAWYLKQVKALEESGNADKVPAIDDKVQCLKIFAKNVQEGASIKHLFSMIDGFFGESVNGNLTLATCHKAKGKEWHKVFILDEEKFRPSWVTMEWMKKQEDNIVYVAVTRAKENLFFIKSDSWK